MASSKLDFVSTILVELSLDEQQVAVVVKCTTKYPGGHTINDESCTRTCITFVLRMVPDRGGITINWLEVPKPDPLFSAVRRMLIRRTRRVADDVDAGGSESPGITTATLHGMRFSILTSPGSPPNTSSLSGWYPAMRTSLATQPFSVRSMVMARGHRRSRYIPPYTAQFRQNAWPISPLVCVCAFVCVLLLDFTVREIYQQRNIERGG